MKFDLRLSAVAFLAILFASRPDPVCAQWVIGPTIGVDVPVADLADVVKAGPMFDVFLGYELADQVLVGANGTLSLLPGKELINSQTLPDLDLWRLMAEIQINALHPAATWELWFGGGVGAAIVAPANGNSTTNFSLTLFADLLYKATQSVSVGASVRGFGFFESGDEFISIPIELKALIDL